VKSYYGWPIAVLVNLFSEAEPFATILIDHGTLGGLLRPEGQERGRGSPLPIS